MISCPNPKCGNHGDPDARFDAFFKTPDVGIADAAGEIIDRYGSEHVFTSVRCRECETEAEGANVEREIDQRTLDLFTITRGPYGDVSDVYDKGARGYHYACGLALEHRHDRDGNWHLVLDRSEFQNAGLAPLEEMLCRFALEHCGWEPPEGDVFTVVGFNGDTPFADPVVAMDADDAILKAECKHPELNPCGAFRGNLSPEDSL